MSDSTAAYAFEASNSAITVYAFDDHSFPFHTCCRCKKIVGKGRTASNACRERLLRNAFADFCEACCASDEEAIKLYAVWRIEAEMMLD